MATTLARHLEREGVDICKDNGCGTDGHNCESYAYIYIDSDGELRLISVCQSDYFQGHAGPYAAIPMPWRGSQEELEDAVKADIEEQNATPTWSHGRSSARA